MKDIRNNNKISTSSKVYFTVPIRCMGFVLPLNILKLYMLPPTVSCVCVQNSARLPLLLSEYLSTMVCRPILKRAEQPPTSSQDRSFLAIKNSFSGKQVPFKGFLLGLLCSLFKMLLLIRVKDLKFEIKRFAFSRGCFCEAVCC